MKSIWRFCALLAGLGLLGLILLSSTAQPVAAQQPEPTPHVRVIPRPPNNTVRIGSANNFTTFLPFVRGGTTGGGGGGGVTANYLMPYVLPGGSIMSNIVPQVGVDPAGGIHVIYTADAPDLSGNRPAYYAYCAAQCTAATTFTTISFGVQVTNAQLSLDPAGHPRVLLTTAPSATDLALVQYYYGECNASCTNPANWALMPLFPAPVYGYHEAAVTESTQSFALDAQGHPRFILEYRDPSSYWNNPQIYYMFCDGTCTNAANWQTTILDSVEWFNIAIAIAPNGAPRILYVKRDSTTNFESWLYYVECDTEACLNPLEYYLVTAATSAIDSSYVYALRLDSAGRPRFAYYPGTGSGGSLATNQLYYVACDANCLSSQNPPPWTALTIPLPTQINSWPAYNGDYGVDLRLDAQNRPRIAYHINSSAEVELGYTWCDANCAVQGAVWNNQVEPSAQATAQALGTIVYSCPDCIPPIATNCQSYWDAGWWPSLALDSAGNPRVAYEVQLKIGLGPCSAETLARFTRLAIFNHP